MARKAVVSADALDDLQYELDEDLVGSFPATTAAGPSGSSVIGSEDGEGVDAAGATLKVAERQANPARASKPKKGKKRQHDAQNLDAGATEGLSSPPKKRKVDLADGSKQGSKRTKKGKGKEKVEEKKAKADKAKKGRTLQVSSQVQAAGSSLTVYRSHPPSHLKKTSPLACSLPIFNTST